MSVQEVQPPKFPPAGDLYVGEEEKEEEVDGDGEDASDDDDDDDDDDDMDIDAAAEEMARNLRAQLWEDMQAEVGAPTATSEDFTMMDVSLPEINGLPSGIVPDIIFQRQRQAQEIYAKNVEAIVVTVKAILSILEKDGFARLKLASTMVSQHHDNVLNILNNIASSGTMDRKLAAPFSKVVLSLAQSDQLFGKLRQSNVSSILLDLGKRKRDLADDGSIENVKRPFIRDDLPARVSDAVQVIRKAFEKHPPVPGHGLPTSLISSVQLQLHQVCLFAVTSSSRNDVDNPLHNSLQELGGMIQILGVLSNIPIGSETSESTDIGTAVYPCPVPRCKKIFSRLSGLRSHAKAHETKSWKCNACSRVFTDTTSLNHHKPTSIACQDALSTEVLPFEDSEEDGQIDATVIAQVQTSVLTLHVLLGGHVSNTLGQGPPTTTTIADDGQATLAHILARTQSQTETAVHAPLPLVAVNHTPTEEALQVLSQIGLSNEQAKMLELAIANAASAAHAQAEAEAEQDADEQDQTDPEGEGEADGDFDIDDDADGDGDDEDGLGTEMANIFESMEESLEKSNI